MSEINVHNENLSAGDKELDLASASHYVIKTRHGVMDATQRALLMGIINVTPDSFYDGGRRLDPAKAVADGIGLVEGGADIIDIGGESTRPGALSVSIEEETRAGSTCSPRTSTGSQCVNLD